MFNVQSTLHNLTNVGRKRNCILIVEDKECTNRKFTSHKCVTPLFMYLPKYCNLSEDIQQSCWQSFPRQNWLRECSFDITLQGHYLSCGNIVPYIYIYIYIYTPSKKLRAPIVKPLKAELIPICHLLALLEDHYIFHISWLSVKPSSTPSNHWALNGCHLWWILIWPRRCAVAKPVVFLILSYRGITRVTKSFSLMGYEIRPFLLRL
jgi:hypothetical protein